MKRLLLVVAVINIIALAITLVRPQQKSYRIFVGDGFIAIDKELTPKQVKIISEKMLDVTVIKMGLSWPHYFYSSSDGKIYKFE